jgi:hypothetical protein
MVDMTPEALDQRIRELEQQVAREKALTARATPQTANEKVAAVKDMIYQAPTGLAKGMSYVAGMPGDAIKLGRAGVSALGFEPSSSPVLGSDEIQQAFTDATGLHARKPDGAAGEWSEELMSFLPSAALGPGSASRKMIGYGVGPFLGSKAGEAMSPEGYEQYGKAAGGMLALAPGATIRTPRRSARNLVADNLDQTAPARLGELGPDAFLGEATPGTTALMQGFKRPGQAMNMLERPVRARDQLKNERIRKGLNDEIGPARDPSAIEESIIAKRTALGPQFETELSKPVLLPPEKAVRELQYLTDELASGTTGQDLTEAKKALDLLQPDGKYTKVGIRQVFKAREALWTNIERLEGKQPTLAKRMKRIYGMINEDLHKSPELRDIDARYSQFSKETDALKEGATVLDQGKEAVWPATYSKRLDDKTPQEVSRLMQGVRAEMERMVGVNANDVATLNKMIRGGVDASSKFNYEKLAITFGRDKADNIVALLKRELDKEENARKILHNSQTAKNQASKEALDRATGEEMPASLFQGMLRAGKYAKDKTLGGMYEGRDQELARLLTLQGAEAQAELPSLLRRQQYRKRGVPYIPGASLLLSPMRDEE